LSRTAVSAIRRPELADLLLEQELLFVVEHGGMVHRARRVPAGGSSRAAISGAPAAPVRVGAFARASAVSGTVGAGSS